MKMPSLSDLKIFVQTAQYGSISAAARELEVSPAAASAAIKRMEEDLGCPLFIRSTRSLRLTTEGESYLRHCKVALEALETGQQELLTKKKEVSGTIRISVPSDFGRNYFLPWLDEFQAEHDGLTFRLELTDRITDIYRENVDIALRYGTPPDSNHVAFNIAQSRRIICGAPRYFEKFGEPRTPEDLRDHNCLLYMIDDRAYDQWKFTRGQDTIRVNVKGNRVSNDAEIVRRWVVAGHGLAKKSVLDMSTDLLNNAVRRTLADYECPAFSLNLICPTRKQVTPVVLLLRDFLRDKCAQVLNKLPKDC